MNVALQFFLMSFRFKKKGVGGIDNHKEDILERKQREELGL